MKIIRSAASSKYKASRYNLAISYAYTGGTVLYNEITGAIALLSAEEYRAFRQGNYEEEHVRQGFVVPEKRDEKEMLARRRQQSLNDPGSQNYAILTTTACNARCYYCFEQGTKPLTMTREVAEQAADFILRQSKLAPAPKIRLMWFGGEPLLNPDAIGWVTKRLHKGGLHPIANITTNGSLLNEDLISRMAVQEDWDIRSAQITLDGTAETYNAAKGYVNPAVHNFDTVLKNIHALLAAGISVTLRLNYDTKNYESLSELISFLGETFSEEEKRQLSTYVNSILPTAHYPTTTVADASMLKLYQQLVSEGLCTLERLLRFGFKRQNCPMSGVYSYSIAPDGRISKCYEVTDRFPVGDLTHGVTEKETDAIWTAGKLPARCEDCKCLPLCQGGCPVYEGEASCTKSFNQRDILSQLLVYYVRERENVL